MIQQRRAHHTEANRLQDKTGKPQRMKTILRLPCAAIARSKPQRDAIAEILPVEEARQEADPVHKGEGRVVGDAEAVAAGFDGLLQPDGRQGVEGDVEAEADGVKACDDEDDGGDGDFEGLDGYGELGDGVST
jgi:hypothetical protein